MTPEHLLVPYQCSDLPSGPWLVFAPHADDETFGMGGALLKASEQGIQTHVVVMTDGALGGEGADLVDTRQSEVEQACQQLGVHSVQCWGQPDRGLGADPEQAELLTEQIAARIADLKAATVFFPGVLELHPDHRRTAALVWQGVQKLMTRPWRAQAPQVWSYEISVQSPVNRLIDITDVRVRKEQAMAVYASQNSQNNYPELILALNKARTFSMPAQVSHVEAFYAFGPDQIKMSLRQAAEQALALYWADEN